MITRNLTAVRMLNDLTLLAGGLTGTLELSVVDDEVLAMIVPKKGIALVGRGKSPTTALRDLWRQVDAIRTRTA